MKSIIRLLFLGALCALCVPLLPSASAVEPGVTVTAPLPPEAQTIILSVFLGLAAKYPLVASLIAVLGSMRLWAKPLFTAIHAIVEITPTQTDDGLWAKAYAFFTENPIGKTCAWLLDYLGSVKLTPPTPPAKSPTD